MYVEVDSDVSAWELAFEDPSDGAARRSGPDFENFFPVAHDHQSPVHRPKGSPDEGSRGGAIRVNGVRTLRIIDVEDGAAQTDFCLFQSPGTLPVKSHHADTGPGISF